VCVCKMRRSVCINRSRTYARVRGSHARNATISKANVLSVVKRQLRAFLTRCSNRCRTESKTVNDYWYFRSCTVPSPVLRMTVPKAEWFVFAGSVASKSVQPYDIDATRRYTSAQQYLWRSGVTSCVHVLRFVMQNW